MLADVITTALVTHRGQPGVSPLNSELHDLGSAYILCPINTHLNFSTEQGLSVFLQFISWVIKILRNYHLMSDKKKKKNIVSHFALNTKQCTYLEFRAVLFNTCSVKQPTVRRT